MFWHELIQLVKKSGELLSFCFKTVFSKENPTEEKLAALSLSDWKNISSPQALSCGTITIFPYENRTVKDAIIAIKNTRNRSIGQSMSLIACDFLLEELAEQKLTRNFSDPLLVPIPTSKIRKRKRGFNPSLFVSEMISEMLPSTPVLKDVLVKTKETRPQKQLSRNERLSNVENSMTVKESLKEKIKGRDIIVIDDVATTGATLLEAKRSLLLAGARHVLTFALAH